MLSLMGFSSISPSLSLGLLQRGTHQGEVQVPWAAGGSREPSSIASPLPPSHPPRHLRVSSQTSRPLLCPALSRRGQQNAPFEGRASR